MRLCLPAVVVFACGCTIGIEGTGPQGGPDANGGGNPDSPSGTPDSPAGFQCRNKITTVGDGHHNPGQDCQGPCHNHGFTLSGTVFTTPASQTPIVGASITVTDASSATFDIVSQANGNFYTSRAVAYPVHVVASSCPDIAMMSGTVAANTGCNNASCHIIGQQGHIHLP